MLILTGSKEPPGGASILTEFTNGVALTAYLSQIYPHGFVTFVWFLFPRSIELRRLNRIEFERVLVFLNSGITTFGTHDSRSRFLHSKSEVHAADRSRAIGDC